ncbi:SNF2 family N-terminal domain-containing protein [Cerioporus squamosus]|nr:SNF2 family N-terminal domain-containing protein [Cerioporus squamosus]
MDGVFVLSKFLSAGALTISIGGELGLVEHPRQHADDGWTTFPHDHDPPVVGVWRDDDDSETWESLRFLIRHRFIAATYLVDHYQSLLFVRVYIVPWDLPGSRGVLRSRDEDSVLRPGRRRLKALFLRIRQDRSLWEGSVASSSTPKHFWDGVVDNRSLLDIYNDLPSPATETLLDEIPGLQSKLYEYQRRTVSTMAARETHRGSIEDPLYLPIRGMDGRTFYMQPAIMEVVSERPRISSVPGGILCEELGTGKTIMMLSLILATLDQLPSPEEAFHEQRIPMTPLSLRHFQTASAIDERAKLSKSKVLRDTGLPPLVEIMMHHIRVAPDGVRVPLREHQAELEQQNLWAPLRANVPFYMHTDPPRDVGYGAARGAQVNAPRVMYLTAATLVVVPDNLQIQWANEILKHCTEVLRVLFVRDKDELPDAPVLATDYDVSVSDSLRFSKEAKKRATEELSTLKPCQCKPLRGSRVPSCKCSRRKSVSPLLQIRWKRLVVDEGHNAAEKRTDYAMFTKLLSIERRWIVTGTPTTNLLGLNFGSGSDLHFDNDVRQRRWHRSEREDFRKLGTMFADFLMMMPFASNPKAFATYVKDPIFEREGPWPGQLQVLTQVMSSVMVRHRIEDVEQDVRLPFLQHETVLLDMDPYAVKTYNLIQATIAVNAVDSERKDQDYLFHPRNAGPLQELVANISHVMFWHVVDSHLDERLGNAERCLRNLENRHGSQEDYALIRESILHIRSALDDPIWMALQRHYHAFHRVERLPSQVYGAWSMFDQHARAICTESLLPPMALLKLRDFIMTHPLRPLPGIIAMGHTVVDEERRWKELEELHARLKKKGSKERRPKDEATNSLGSLKRATAEQKLEELRREYHAAAARLSSADSGEEAAPVRQEDAASQRKVASTLLRLSPVAGVRVKNSTSSKLDYILNEVLLYSAREKFLIFSESPATLSFIAEALDLIRVKYLEFSGKLKREQRQAIITTFETSEVYRVLLMELKHGARGLNVTSASRVIFCEPVWRADVESQAIKRVHRIGQSRNVRVKTLAIRGTSEEVMVARSKALKEGKEEFSKEITDDRTIRDFIEHPIFLPIPTERLVNLDVPLFEFAPQPSTDPVNGNANCQAHAPPAAPRPPQVRIVDVVDTPTPPPPPLPRRSTVYVELPAMERPRKKQRLVRFTDG